MRQVGIIVPSRLHMPNVFQQRLANTLNDGLRPLLLRATSRSGSSGRHSKTGMLSTNGVVSTSRSFGRLEGQSIEGRAGLGTLGRQVADVTSAVRPPTIPECSKRSESRRGQKKRRAAKFDTQPQSEGCQLSVLGLREGMWGGAGGAGAERTRGSRAPCYLSINDDDIQGLGAPVNPHVEQLYGLSKYSCVGYL